MKKYIVTLLAAMFALSGLAMADHHEGTEEHHDKPAKASKKAPAGKKHGKHGKKHEEKPADESQHQ